MENVKRYKGKSGLNIRDIPYLVEFICKNWNSFDSKGNVK